MSDNLPTTPQGFVRPAQVASDNPAPLGYIAGVSPQRPDVDEYRKRFDVSRDFLAEHRRRAMEDRDYYDGDQLSPQMRQVLSRRKQPEIITNRIRPAIDGVLGVMEAGKTDPRCYPRNPGGQDAADVASKILRYIADLSSFDQVKLDCAENQQIEGVCAVIIEGAPDDDVNVTQVRWEEFYYDPHSKRPDFKDARWLGVAKWMDEADLKSIYADELGELGDICNLGDDTFEDKPDNAPRWVDKVRRRVMVCEEYYQRGGEWNRVVFIAAGVLEHGKSPYTDDKGRSICAIEATTAYINRKNERYGRVRDMKPLQNEINARRSRYLHLANTRQVQQVDPNAAPIDPQIVSEEAAKPNGVIPPGWQVAPNVDMASAQAVLLQDAKAEIERMGPTPAVLGRQDGSAQSGRARLVLQQAGMTELARVLGRFEDFEQRCYKQMWWRARQFWSAPKFIRVTDEQRAAEFIQINEPVMGMVQMPVADPTTGEPVLDPMTGQPQMTIGQGPVGYNNHIAQMDVDIIVDSVPDTANLQQEVWQELMQLMQIMPPDDPRFELAVEMSPLADKTRVIERMKSFREEMGQQQAAQQQQQATMQDAAMQMDMKEREAKAANNMAGARQKIADADKKQAETQAMFAGFSPFG